MAEVEQLFYLLNCAVTAL